MVAIKKLLSFVGVITSVLASPVAIAETEKGIFSGPSPDALVARGAPVAVAERQISRPMSLRWSPSGQILFLIGIVFPLPPELTMMIRDLGPAGPAQLLLEEFLKYFTENADFASRLVFDLAKAGGFYGVGPRGENTFGFGLQLPEQNAKELDTSLIMEVVKQWALQGGGRVDVARQANGFVTLDDLRDIITIGNRKKLLKPRARDGTCPAKIPNLRQFAGGKIPDLDFERELRFGGRCRDD
ncbi:hypothetical protein AJ80_09359 [Polytolypa hystricis UAMH7299]|uniref:Peptidase S53 activation domain-containing protein n=1 Tax=Polytolypa hystricis (strain UAMH7299) TaxID=1447883 RepID=A0A2B7WRP8_POLH7|nr:hypothetical protein AJ80_09359 [Polytolypa hystricis UAMH7299]